MSISAIRKSKTNEVTHIKRPSDMDIYCNKRYIFTIENNLFLFFLNISYYSNK